jgi:hypothetical protein
MSESTVAVEYAWIPLGRHARGLICHETLIGVVYWIDNTALHSAEEASDSDAVTAGYYAVHTETPTEHLQLAEADEPGLEWDQDILSVALDYMCAPVEQ